MSLALDPGGLLSWANDPEPTAGELVFDFVAGSVALLLSGETAGATGTLAETLDNATMAASGASGASGTVAVTLANATSAASGTHTTAVTGTVAATLAAATSAAMGTATGIANYTYDWAGSNGAAWVGWTSAVGTNDIQSNKGRQLTAAAAYAVAAAYYNSPLPQNYELRVDTTITTVTAGEFYGAINLRAASTSFTDMMQWSSWHLRFVGTATSGVAELYRINSTGSATFLTLGTDIDFVQGSVLHVRLWLAGQVFRARYWKNAEPEPPDWQISGTDSLAPTGSSLSLAVRNGAAVAADDWRWDDLAITTNVAGTVAVALDAVTASASGNEGSTDVAVNADGVIAYATSPQVAAGELAFNFVTGSVELLIAGAAAAAAIPAVTGTLAKSLGNATSNASGGSGGLAVTLDGVTTAGPILDENGNPVLDENGNPVLVAGAYGFVGLAGTLAATLGPVTSVASGTTTSTTPTGTVAKTLANVTSTTAGTASIAGTLARTLQNATLAAAGGSSNASTLAETLDPVVLQAAGATGVSGSVNVGLGNVIASASGAASLVTGTVAVTLDAVEANAPLTDESGSVITDESGNPLYVRGAEGLHGIGGTVAVTLANITSSTGGGTVTGTLAETLDAVTLSASGGPSIFGTLAETLEDSVVAADGGTGVSGTLAETLADATCVADGVVAADGSLDITLGAVTATASGTSTPTGAAGNANITLADTTSAASGGSGVSGELALALADAVAAAGGTVWYGNVAATLADLTAAATGTAGEMPVTGLAAIILADITSQTEGLHTVTGDLDRTLADVTAAADGSTIAGTLDEVLDDVTSTTYGNVTITVYGIGTIEAIYQAGPIDTVFETGRIVAVAGSAH